MPAIDWLKKRGLSTKAAEQIRIGIATGEIIFNLYVKGECEAVRRAMIDASKAPKLTYEVTIQTLTDRLRSRGLTMQC